jgi:hypothetical protein
MTSEHDQNGKRDLRAYARTTQSRLILGGLLLVLFVGVGLIYLFYGRQAALMGLLCVLVGMGPIVLIVLWLFGFEAIVERWRAGE